MKKYDSFECPECNSGNTETYIDEKKEYCLECGIAFHLTDELYEELLKDRSERNE